METTPNEELINATLNSTKEAENVISLTLLAILIKTVAILVVILNFLFNPLMLLTLRRVTSIQPTTKMFMAALTVSDLCNGLGWLATLHQVFAESWMLGEVMCVVLGVAVYAINGLALFSLLLLTIDRYIAIAYPLRYPTLITVYRSWIMICATWIAAFLVNTMMHGINNQRIVVKVGPQNLCLSPHNDWSRSITGGIILLALAAMAILYVRIFLIAHRQARRIAAENQAGNGQGGQRIERINTRSSTTIIIITGTLVVTYIPTVFRLTEFTPQASITAFDIYLTSVLPSALLMSNSWLNVIIYYIRNRALRQALRDLLSEWRQRLVQRL